MSQSILNIRNCSEVISELNWCFAVGGFTWLVGVTGGSLVKLSMVNMSPIVLCKPSRDFLAKECLCINLGRGSRYACFNKHALPTSQVVSCLQCLLSLVDMSAHSYITIWVMSWSNLQNSEGEIYGQWSIPQCAWGWVYSLERDRLLTQEWTYWCVCLYVYTPVCFCTGAGI